MILINALKPDARGYWGEFGGRFVPEVLVAALEEIEQAWVQAQSDSQYQTELEHLLTNYAGRPTPMYEAKNLSDRVGSRIFIKREDLAHTGSHKINNVLGQALLARNLQKTRLIAETGAGQHGVATATAAALLGLSATIYMGSRDAERQALNVYRMRLLGAEVVEVDQGSATLKDAINEALRDWVASVESTHYVLGSVVGPHPFPWMVAQLQSVIGVESKEQIHNVTGAVPDMAVACVGGGSNAAGLFAGFIDDETALMGVEAGGDSTGHSATLSCGTTGVIHGAASFVLQDSVGSILEAHSISAGLDYPGVGPWHAYLKQTRRATYVSVTDAEAVKAFKLLCSLEGLVPALESSHAFAWLIAQANKLPKVVCVCLSGRGDKDVEIVREMTGA